MNHGSEEKGGIQSDHHDTGICLLHRHDPCLEHDSTEQTRLHHHVLVKEYQRILFTTTESTSSTNNLHFPSY